MVYKLNNSLAQCLATKGVSKAHLARRIGKSRAYVTRLERGEVNPSAPVMLAIGQYFGKPVEQIFQLVGQEAK